MKNKEFRWIWKKIMHILLSFLIGVILATAYHLIITNKQVRKTAEAVCENFGRDEQECKAGIDNVLDMSDEVVDNNINVGGEK